MTKVLPACVGPEGDVISANFLLLLSTCYYQKKKNNGVCSCLCRDESPNLVHVQDQSMSSLPLQPPAAPCLPERRRGGDGTACVCSDPVPSAAEFGVHRGPPPGQVLQVQPSPPQPLPLPWAHLAGNAGGGRGQLHRPGGWVRDVQVARGGVLLTGPRDQGLLPGGSGLLAGSRLQVWAAGSGRGRVIGREKQRE